MRSLPRWLAIATSMEPGEKAGCSTCFDVFAVVHQDLRCLRFPIHRQQLMQVHEAQHLAGRQLRNR